jgi:hypothetical protein
MHGPNKGFVYKIPKPFLQVKRFRERFTYILGLKLVIVQNFGSSLQFAKMGGKSENW